MHLYAIPLHIVTRTGALEILRQLAQEQKRFSEFTYINKRTLAKRLRELEEADLISRKVLDERPVKVVYELTQKGKEILASVKELERKLRTSRNKPRNSSFSLEHH